MKPNALTNFLLVLAVFGVSLWLAILAGFGSADWFIEQFQLDRKKMLSAMPALLVAMFSGGAVFYAIRTILLRIFFEPDSKK